MHQGTWPIKDIDTKVKSTLLIFVSAALSTKAYWQNMLGLHTKSQFQNIILDSNQPVLFYKRSIYVTSSFKILVTFRPLQSLREEVLDFSTLHFCTYQLTNMPTKQKFSYGSVAILAYTAVFVCAIIWIYYCILPLFHKK